MREDTVRTWCAHCQAYHKAIYDLVGDKIYIRCKNCGHMRPKGFPYGNKLS